MTTDPSVMATGAACCAPEHLHYAAVVGCGLANTLVTGVWCIALGKTWMKAAKVTIKKLSGANMPLVVLGWVGSSFLIALSTAYLLKLTHAGDTTSALRAAWSVWVGFTLAASVNDYITLRRGWRLFALNMGQYLLLFTLSAVLLTAWH